ncbi:Solitary outer membrane autotransporter beta-barrel domain [Vibrio sp. 16]|uniref:Solitary outer membrane autotransporter beta-barrel domain n=1 Tax=Vibrio sp. 16 TaxID=391586 RepID=UPI002FEF1DC3
MKSQRLTYTALVCSLIPVMSVNAKQVDAFRNYLEQAFATSIVLTDSDVFTLGIHDFDPNDWFNMQNEDIGSEESVQLRQQIAATTLPYTFDLAGDNETGKHLLFTRLSAIRSEQDFEVPSVDIKDVNDEYVVGGFVAYRYQYKLNDHWTLTPGFGLHLQYFRNSHDYRSDLSEEFVKPQLDGVLFNTSAWALSYEPHVKAKYHKTTEWGSWNFSSTFHYFYGYGWGEANHGVVGHPEGWYMANGADVYYNVSQLGESVQSVYASLRRIEIGGDTSKPLATPHYYEASLGWLMTPPFHTELIDNVGIGLNLNYGSALRGGSIVFFFNQVD